MTGRVGKVQEPQEIAVIGAGIGGMCTAARLAKAGHSVTIFEASSRTGGKCRTEWIGRYAFDTGPSLLTIPAVFRDFFQRTGDVMGRVLELQAVDPSFEYRFDDGKRVAFSNLSRKKTLESIELELGVQAAQEWNAALSRAEAMWDVARTPFIESELKSPAKLLFRKKFLRDLKVIAPFATLRSFDFKDWHLRNIMDRYATYSGSDTRVAPAVLSTIAFIEESFGAWHVKGGLGKLSDAIESRCEKLGVQVYLNTKVSSINVVSGKVTGVTLASGEMKTFDKVVSNADAGVTYNSLISSNSRKVKKVRKQLAQTTPSFAGFSLLLGLRQSSHPLLKHHTILFPENYDAEFDALFATHQPVAEPTIYICAPLDTSMTTVEGSQAWSVLVNAPRHSATGDGFDWSNQEFNRAYANSIIDRIEAAGISVRDRLDIFEIRTPLDLQNSVSAPGGSIYGTSSNGPRAAFLRARNRSPIKGLYMVGGSAHPGGGLPLVGLSAEMVAEAILEKSR